MRPVSSLTAMLDLLGCRLLDHHAELGPDIPDDRLVKIIASDLDAGADHDPVHGEDRDVAASAPDVHDHVPARL